eukprot:TRINITY_DN48586_c0_g1_i4.p1 TRINITY_DN48586_c0_g1~~TRINITY_DN48586_c0_g1_i4.p1  ORF type:complete len:140 (+),score=25.44 TRINITY_DN48586_c0_g1_i4:112-531(+)
MMPMHQIRHGRHTKVGSDSESTKDTSTNAIRPCASIVLEVEHAAKVYAMDSLPTLDIEVAVPVKWKSRKKKPVSMRKFMSSGSDVSPTLSGDGDGVDLEAATRLEAAARELRQMAYEMKQLEEDMQQSSTLVGASAEVR